MSVLRISCVAKRTCHRRDREEGAVAPQRVARCSPTLVGSSTRAVRPKASKLPFADEGGVWPKSPQANECEDAMWDYPSEARLAKTGFPNSYLTHRDPVVGHGGPAKPASMPVVKITRAFRYSSNVQAETSSTISLKQRPRSSETPSTFA